MHIELISMNQTLAWMSNWSRMQKFELPIQVNTHHVLNGCWSASRARFQSYHEFKLQWRIFDLNICGRLTNIRPDHTERVERRHILIYSYSNGCVHCTLIWNLFSIPFDTDRKLQYPRIYHNKRVCASCIWCLFYHLIWVSKYKCDKHEIHWSRFGMFSMKLVNDDVMMTSYDIK